MQSYYSPSYVKEDKNLEMVNKLIILFILDKMEAALSDSTLEEICISNGWLNLEFRPTLEHLVESEFVCTVKQENIVFYSITAKGRSSLAEFYAVIQKSTREEISRFVKLHGQSLKQKQEYQTDYFQNVDGTHTVVLRIMEVIGVNMEIRLVVPTKKSASEICKKWPSKAESLHAIIYENLVDS